jgi:hypothetical protein
MIKKFLLLLTLILISLKAIANTSNFNYSFIQFNHSKINTSEKYKEDSINFSKSIDKSFFYSLVFNRGEFYSDPIRTNSYSVGIGSNKSLNEITDLAYSIQIAKSNEKNLLSGNKSDEDTLNLSIEIKHIINDLEISGGLNYTNFAILDSGDGHNFSYGLGLSLAINDTFSFISSISHDDENTITFGVELSL